MVHGSVYDSVYGSVHGLVHGLVYGLVDLGHFPDTQGYLGLLPEPCRPVTITQAH